jgi:hypothetical protein
MLDGLYDDVISVMTENGFVEWFERNHRNKISPLKWCYDVGGGLKEPTTPPKGITWSVNSYDQCLYYPYKCSITDNGDIEPTY